METETKKPKSMKQGSPDDFQTPKEALLPLIPFIKKEWTIWECAEGKGNLVQGLKEFGFNVIGSDILTGSDFLGFNQEKYDCIITNPPFSIKQEFIERCYQLKKPFALLLPLTTFETWKRQKLFRENGVQVIFFDKRIKFETPTGKSGKHSSPWFATAWFTWGLNLPKDMMFVKLNY
jgi:hypothetical protein